ncbi:unnamed protein product [Paramecium sonneborni]|uniref:Transmembrane protein n=1 Tax=Paramecium sonneborni TaxID=65129 RepID=A0A8S1PQF3_9CILI|nr:unnamed protein product [Paramecium sonneborni]
MYQTTQLFHNQLQLMSLTIECQIYQDNLVPYSLVYNVSYNGTTIGGHLLNFQVSLVSTYLQEHQPYQIIILININILLFIFPLIIIMIFKWYHNLRKEKRKIAKRIQGYCPSIPTSGKTNTQQTLDHFHLKINIQLSIISNINDAE